MIIPGNKLTSYLLPLNTFKKASDAQLTAVSSVPLHLSPNSKQGPLNWCYSALKYPLFADSNPQLTEQFQLQNVNPALEIRFLIPWLTGPLSPLHAFHLVKYTVNLFNFFCSFVFSLCTIKFTFGGCTVLWVWAHAYILITTTTKPFFFKTQNHFNTQRIPPWLPLCGQTFTLLLAPGNYY